MTRSGTGGGDPTYLDPVDVLRGTFGHAAFRGGQEGVVRHLLEGGDAIALFPTGAGKSLCYQVPALCRPGLTVVVSPLVALMRDQVNALVGRGVAAASMNSTLSPEETLDLAKRVSDGQVRILYVTPERLKQSEFVAFLQRSSVGLIAIDEAHCVSQWGHDFRPDYMALGRLRELFPDAPILAATATADPQTREDLKTRLNLQDAKVFSTSFDRPNISYAIVEKARAWQDQILEYLEPRRGVSGIVYALSRGKVDQIAERLRLAGHRATSYHAGMTPLARAKAQDEFQGRRDTVVVATVAFGMGIDKPDVRYVVHADLPSSIESYYQETGRAGRDGLPSEAFMAFGKDDLAMRRRFIDNGNASAVVKDVSHLKLDALLGICETTECRRQAILSHFGERHPGGCGNCDTCLRPVARVDGSVAARKVLNAIRGTGERYGADDIVAVMRGTPGPRVKAAKGFDLEGLATGQRTPVETWATVIRQLRASGTIEVDYANKGGLRLARGAESVLRGEEPAYFRPPSSFAAAPVPRTPRHDEPEAPPHPGDAEPDVVDAGPSDEDVRPGGALSRYQGPAPTVPPPPTPGKAVESVGGARTNALFRALKSERDRQARKAKVKPFVVFTDQTIRDMALSRPRNRIEMVRIPGVGATKLDRYGAAFLSIIATMDLDSGPERTSSRPMR